MFLKSPLQGVGQLLRPVAMSERVPVFPRLTQQSLFSNSCLSWYILEKKIIVVLIHGLLIRIDTEHIFICLRTKCISYKLSTSISILLLIFQSFVSSTFRSSLYLGEMNLLFVIRVTHISYSSFTYWLYFGRSETLVSAMKKCLIFM